ncbi:MAG: hypothetical protein DRN81_07275 [Thermoproteota archaeon]|nr:MAG: hypothetical protein DRN81_07275 [Candidatus Korarchaeota archaeon]
MDIEKEKWERFLRDIQRLFQKYGEKAISRAGREYERVDLWEVEEKENWTTGFSIRFQLAVASFEFQRFLKEKHGHRYWLFGKYLCRRRIDE